MFRTIHNKEDTSRDISNVFKTIRLLFNEWVNSELSKLDFKGKRKDCALSVLEHNALYLNF